MHLPCYAKDTTVSAKKIPSQKGKGKKRSAQGQTKYRASCSCCWSIDAFQRITHASLRISPRRRCTEITGRTFALPSTKLRRYRETHTVMTQHDQNRFHLRAKGFPKRKAKNSTPRITNVQETDSTKFDNTQMLTEPPFSLLDDCWEQHLFPSQQPTGRYAAYSA